MSTKAIASTVEDPQSQEAKVHWGKVEEVVTSTRIGARSNRKVSDNPLGGATRGSPNFDVCSHGTTEFASLDALIAHYSPVRAVATAC